MSNSIYDSADKTLGWTLEASVLTEDAETAEVIHDPDPGETRRTAVAFKAFDGQGRIWLTDPQATVLLRGLEKSLGLTAIGGPGTGSTDGGGWNKSTLGTAIDNDLTVTFGYAKGDGSVIERRTLSPSALTSSHGNDIVVGYDPDRDDVRAYRLDRIKGYVQAAS